MVSYTTRYYNLDNIIVSRMGEVVVGANYVFPKPLMSHRTYDINAVLTTGVCVTKLDDRRMRHNFVCVCVCM